MGPHFWSRGHITTDSGRISGDEVSLVDAIRNELGHNAVVRLQKRRQSSTGGMV